MSRLTAKWFDPDTEFRCRCGRPDCPAPVAPHRLLLRYLDIVRDQYGQPLVVTSANRCAVHNAAVGGEDASEHVWADGCLGCDIAPADAVRRGRLSSHERFRLLDAIRVSGITRYGVRYDKHVHVGVGNLVAEAKFPGLVAW